MASVSLPVTLARSGEGSPAAASRRAVLRAVGPLGGVAALAVAGCEAGGRVPLLGGPKVVRAAAFLSQDGGPADRGVVELQRAANALNRQNPGYEVRVDYLLLPPRPTPGPPAAPAPSAPAEGAGPAPTPFPTPTPFAPYAIALEHANTGGELAAGAPPPDVVLITQTFDLPQVLQRGLLTPVEDLLRAERVVAPEDFAPGALEAARTRGRLAVLPLAGTVNVLLFDTALFSAAGVDRPSPDWTWGQFVEACRRLTRPPAAGGGGQWGTLAHSAVPLLLAMLWGHGGELLAKDGKRSLLAEAPARQAAQLWADLLHRHRVAPIPGPGEGLQLNWSQHELWLISPQPGQPVVIGGGASAGSSPRLATVMTSSLPSLYGGPGTGQPRTIWAADVPKGTARGTWFTLGAALAVGAKTDDPRLALRAGMALADHLLQAPVGFGFPVRRPEATLLRQVQPRLAEEDAEAVASALAYSRGIPPELTQLIYPILTGKLMTPLLRGQTTVEDACQEASTALDEALRA